MIIIEWGDNFYRHFNWEGDMVNIINTININVHAVEMNGVVIDQVILIN